MSDIRVGLSFCCLFLVLPYLEGQAKDSKTREEENPVRATADFNVVHLVGVGKVTIHQAAKCGVATIVPKGFAGTPEYHVKGNELVITGGGGTPRIDIPGIGDLPKGVLGKPIEYVVSVKDLKGILLSGSGGGEVVGLQGKSLVISITGTGTLIAAGNLQSLHLNISGIGGFDGRKLQTKTIRVNHDGAGRAIVNAKDSLDIRLTGIGAIEYLGGPRLHKSVTGIGRVSPFPK